MRVVDTLPDRWDEAEPPAAAAVLPTAKAMIGTTAAIPPSRDRFAFLTADGQAATPLEQEALLGNNDLLDASYLDRCILVRGCVGRIRFETPRGRGYATGFLIAPGILLTNHHVFGTAAAARGASVEFDYRYDVAGQLPARSDEFDFDPERFFVSDEALDFAAVAVADTSTLDQSIAARGYLRLIAATGKIKQGEYVTIVQHPDGLAMQVALRENAITRLEPGEDFIWYNADTTHGSSGAAVFNDSLQLVALHSSGHIVRDAQGRYGLKDGGFADTLDGLGENDVRWDANVGIRISRIAPTLLAAAQAGFPQHVPALEAAMRGGDVLGGTVGAIIETSESRIIPKEPAMPTPAPTPPPAGSQTLIVPLELRISVGLPGGDAAAGGLTLASSTLETEAKKFQIPIIYDGLNEREGFQPDYLTPGVAAPGPVLTTKGKALTAPMLDGKGTELKYGHFSVWMHKERRLALFTASNVDFRERPKMVDGKSTARKPLAGFPETGVVLEQWVTDPRLDTRYQLPDIFYSEDREAFDKGHIVRRDDVCWGKTYEEIQMANGDTYHVTNCSPQISSLNQSGDGVDNWGDLELFIEKTTKAAGETAIVYAGPVFGAADRWFNGKDDDGATRVQIPTRFWKIVVTKGAAGLEAYGFILEQDVTAITEKEFALTPNWKSAFKPIAEIDTLLRGWVSLDALLPLDQYARVMPTL